MASKINFFTEETSFVLSDKMKIRTWLTDVIEKEGYKVGEISIIFCSDEYLLNLNKQYLNHTTFTDIITFDYSDKQKISGDIFISIERVFENALKFKISERDELLRVMVHGVLHLCGHKDKTKEDRKKMHEMENFYKHIILNYN